ncbi:cyclase family protein [Planosporangium thailandense]|uniref:Cyclase family protein n=1 Tax=Planosporangium thailandense TaxID=765197 RepID=A0ABX0XXN3_9ACTN|nr:cyclase family protein [Planosporangium thailandense]NJC69938.1 cyclase family protein [Planosporangium thailandense]
MRVIDISSPIDATFWEPDPVKHEVMSPADGARHVVAEMREHFGLDLRVEDFPGGEFLNNDFLYLSAHTGTHIDAPAHYGSRGSYGRPRTVDELPLEWFHNPGVLIDLSQFPVGTVGAGQLRSELERIGYELSPQDIVLLNTGASRLLGTPDYFTTFVGLDRSATEFLLDQGIRVIGTDAFSLDAPFPHIIKRFQETGDPNVLWPAHMAGRRVEYCQIERLGNLTEVPRPFGFTVSCFPIKIARGGAGWSRAVALLDD